jgi:hypothetical protein
MSDESTVADVAAWMLADLQSRKYLDQQQAVWNIQRHFGKKFIYYNENGNPAIDRNVLKEFRKLTGEEVVWSRTDRQWRYRTNTDNSGRQQDY